MITGASAPIYTTNMQQQLKTLRQQAGLTQSELAELANVSAVTICHVEQGKANVSMATLAKIATALHATVRVKIEPIITKREVSNSI